MSLEARSATFATLRNVLAELYSDQQSARRIADDAALDSSLMHGRVLDGWHALLGDAKKKGRVDVLIEKVMSEYGENDSLKDAVAEYRGAHSSATSRSDRASTLPLRR
jgi:hypothetical protein